MAHKHVEFKWRSCEAFTRKRKTTSIDITRGPRKCISVLEHNGAAKICKYLECFIELRPDIYVSELQNALFTAYGTEFDGTTITQALY